MSPSMWSIPRDPSQPTTESNMLVEYSPEYPSYIYGLTDPRTGAVRYIGKTSRKLKYAVRYRLNSHIAETRENPSKTHKTRWISALLNLGLEPEAVIIDELNCTSEELSALERKRIEEYRANGLDLTNTTAGGDGGSGKLSEEEKAIRIARLVVANTGAKRSEQARLNMRKAHALRDPAERARIAKKASDAAKAAGISEDGRRRISESSRRPCSPETRARMREAAIRREAKKREGRSDD